MTSVADIVVRRLRDAGVCALFGMPGGGSNLDLIEAAGRAGVPFVLTATETGAALAAIAQAEISGRPGACLTTMGPGVASAINGVACAWLDRVPLVVLTDSYPSSSAVFEHQRIDHQALLAPVTKCSVTLTEQHAGDEMERALAAATSLPPGPVHIELTAEVAGLKSPVTSRPSQVSSQRSPPRQTTADSRLATEDSRLATGDSRLTTGDLRLVTDSRRPILLVGLGARHQADAAAIRSLCRTHGVPAMVTYKAKGVVPDTDPHFAGVFSNGALEQPILAQADLFIGVGLDPVEVLPREWTHPQPIVSCAPWRVSDRHIPFRTQIVGDIPAALKQIGSLLSQSTWDLDDVHRTFVSQRQRVCVENGVLPPHRVVQVVADAAVAATRVAVDAGAHMFPATMLWPVDEPNGMLISNGLSTMGFALPAAIGASLLDQDGPTIALTGDGGLLMCAGELLTAARENLRVVTIVLSDGSLSLIDVKQRQRQLASAGVTLGAVAWCALAESLGVSAYLAADEDELDRALAQALDHPGPSLIEARVDPSGYDEVLRAVRG